MTTPTARGILLGVLVLAAIITGALAIDVMHRVLGWPAFGAGDVAVLLTFESLRVLLLAGGIAVAVIAQLRCGGRDVIAGFGIGALLLALAAARALTGPMPGPVQEAVAGALLDRGVPQTLLAIVFVHAEWFAWLALPPLLRFAARYPRPLTVDDVLASGRADRRGALRNVALAGTDIGMLARRFTAHLLATGRLDGRTLWPLGIALAAAHTTALVLVPQPARFVVHLVAAAAAALALTVLIALLRAGHAVSTGADRRLLDLLRRGALVAAVLGVIVVLGELLPMPPLIGGIALYLAPLALLAGALAAVLARPRHESELRV